MIPAELYEALRELAEECELELRWVAGGSEAPKTSGVCRLRDRVYVLLAASDPLERRIQVLAAALREHAGSACEGRYLAPAVRRALDAGLEETINPA